jgi:hypothetical protein
MAKQKIPIDWSIKNLDSETLLTPPYPLGDEGLRVTAGADYAKQNRFGFQDPITQWTSGRVKTITFTSIMFTEDNSESIVREFLLFEDLAIKDETLGRPPICVFTLGSGSVLSELCVVESVDPEIPPIRPDGEPREIRLSFSISRYVPFSLTTIDPTKPAKQSYFLVASTAESSYEAIAKTIYGSALSGDRLRKRHPDMPMQPTVGNRVKIPPKDLILQEVVEPEFHALSLENEEALENFRNILSDRNEKKTTI